jgi:hypothetical protein
VDLGKKLRLLGVRASSLVKLLPDVDGVSETTGLVVNPPSAPDLLADSATNSVAVNKLPQLF